MPDSLERVCLSGDYQAFVRQQLDAPYTLYDRLRKVDPIHWCKPMHCWLLTRYSDVFSLLKDSRLSTNRGGLYLDPLTPENRLLAGPLVNHINTWMLAMDEPRHTRCRRLVSLAFTPRMITGLRPMIERVVGELLDHLVKQRQVEFMREFAEKLPAYVISDMLGISRKDRDNFQEWAVAVTRFSAAAGADLNDFVAPASTGLENLMELFNPLISERRLQPKNDLISSMLLVEEDGDHLSRAPCAFFYSLPGRTRPWPSWAAVSGYSVNTPSSLPNCELIPKALSNRQSRSSFAASHRCHAVFVGPGKRSRSTVEQSNRTRPSSC